MKTDFIKVFIKTNNESLKKEIKQYVNKYNFQIKIEEVDKTQAFNKTELIHYILKQIRKNEVAKKFLKDKKLKESIVLIEERGEND